mgnify:CR=1 FL=1
MFGLEIELTGLKLNMIMKWGLVSIVFLNNSRISKENYLLVSLQIPFDLFLIPLCLILKIKILSIFVRKKVSRLMVLRQAFISVKKKAKMKH